MKNNILRAYLLLGPEEGEKRQRIATIQKALVSEFGPEVETSTFFPFEGDNGELMTTLNNDSLFAAHRLVILTLLEDMPAKLANDLHSYLQSPSQSATLIITSPQHYIQQKVASLIPKSHTHIFWEMFENRKVEWLRALFSQNGCTATTDAIDMLLELVENNTQQLRLAAQPLITYALDEQEGRITAQTVEQYIKHTRQESPFSLFEQIGNGTFERALGILHTLFESQQGEPIGLIGGLLWQFRRLLSLTEHLDQGELFEDACLQASVMGKPAPIKRKKDQTTYRQAAKRYSSGACRSIIARLGEYDIKLRQMGADFHLLLLEQLIGSIMHNGGQASAVWEGLSFFTDVRF
jgi:DNA polymerase-3 subunit delta